MIEFGEPLHIIVGFCLFTIFGFLVGMQFGSINAQKNDD